MSPDLNQKLQTEQEQFLTAPLIKRHLRELGETHPEEYLRKIGPAGGAAGDPNYSAAKAQNEDQQMLQSGEPLPAHPDDDHAAEIQIHEQDLQMTNAASIALHILQHQQFLEQGAAGQGGAASGPMGGPISPVTANQTQGPTSGPVGAPPPMPAAIRETVTPGRPGGGAAQVAAMRRRL